jgi:hypothetical protein
MGARDRTAEILEVKQRESRSHGFVSFELETLIRRWSKTNQSAESTPDFYLIRSVTYLEVFTRRQVAELIDHAKEYTDRAVDLAKWHSAQRYLPLSA